ncbi:MAG TPA: DUF481 domain-containing protein [Candidatus Kapabacteria bacterium]|nr:DUF481 domain-containing protein [Candidatus Kapabacteria bacterium]HPO62540.1 DUF481 domain-containing protein [Candidatus Kapabacteria bacterium]
MKSIILCLFFFLFKTVTLFSQVNVEMLLEREEKNGLDNSFTLSSDLDAGNSEDWTFVTDYRTDWVQDRFYTFFVSYFKYKEASGTVSTRKAHFHFRSILNHRHRLMPEVFVQNNFDNGFNLNNRWLAGGGLRIGAIRVSSDNDSNKVLNVDIGVGAMYEYEDYRSPNRYISRYIKSTNYINLYTKLNENANFQFISYFQFSPKRFADRVSLTDAILEFKIFKHLSFSVNLHYRYDNEPPPGLKYYDLELINGLTVKF